MLMTVSYLAVSFVVTRGSVIGGWDNHVLGVPHAAVWDPGGMYLGNGLLLFDEPNQPYVGHPGLTLTLLCHVTAKTLHWMSASPLTFDAFAARNIHWLFFACMVVITGSFLVAFLVLERVALRVLGNQRLAFVSVVAFATTYPVLYYLNRISPEPLLVTFTLLAFLWLWRYHESTALATSLGFLALSAQAAVAALFTKFLIVGPIVLFIPLQILFRRGARMTLRIRDAALFLLFAAPALALGSLKTDWAYFFSSWFVYAPGAPQYEAGRHWLFNVLANAGGTAWAMFMSSARSLSPAGFMPSFDSRTGLFFASEGLFLLISLAGLVLYWTSCRNRPVLLAWFLGFLCMTLVPYLQRGAGGAWHYLFVHLAVASVFFSYGVSRLVYRLTRTTPDSWKGLVLTIGATIAINSLAFVLFVDMHRYNASQRPFWELYYRAPSMIEGEGRIGLAHTLTMAEILQPISTYLPLRGFLEEYQRLFVAVPMNQPASWLRDRNIQFVIQLDSHGLTATRVSNSP